MDDDAVVREVAATLHDTAGARARCDVAAGAMEPLVTKAAWAAAATGVLAPEQAERFGRGYLDAWADFFLNAAYASRGVRADTDIEIEAERLYVCWHFPEYPLLLPVLRESEAMVLIAQHADWMVAAAGPERLQLFLDGSGRDAIRRAFADGRPVVAMLDYCYDQTRAVTAPFLGRDCRTPSGSLALSARAGYGIEVIGCRDGTIGIAERIDPRAAGIEQAAAAINDAFGRDIRASPDRWLLWPSLDRRWPERELNLDRMA